MIFDDTPSNWHQLEERVAQAFNEMGCKATTDVTIPKIRSSSQIDVYVEDPTLSPPAIYLCECKHWRKPVPKSVVQQFRTIISDAGANLGIIISQKGFQSGAHQETRKTNMRLYSWLDFQKAFEERWMKAMNEKFSKLVYECSGLASDLDDVDSSPDCCALARELGWDLLVRASLLVKIASWKETVVEKHESVRICETGPELTASQTDTWIRLSTKREFYDYAIRVAEKQKRAYQQALTALRADPKGRMTRQMPEKAKVTPEK